MNKFLEEEETTQQTTQPTNQRTRKPAPKKQIKKKTNSTSRFITEKDEEALILEVQKRRPLWDISSPVAERPTSLIDELWKEVSEELEGRLSPSQCKNKFKSLKETYRDIIQSELRPSGSAAPINAAKWQYYEIMDFLRDSCLVRPTRSNDEEIIKRKDLAEENTKSKRKKRNDSSAAINKIAEAICSPPKIELPPMPPMPPKLDGIDGFLLMIGERMRKMTEQARDRFILMMTQAAIEAQIN